MAGDSRSREILKLVHPGGIKEIHRKPIRACEVMKKNPRHCVTRPDVFKFPGIVVHPDSLLKPGGVFYVVPNHTLHCLRRRVKPEKYDGSPGKRSFVGENEFFEQARTVQFLRPGERTNTHVYDLQDKKSPSVSGTRSKIDCKYEDWQGNDIFPEGLLSPELKRKSPTKSTLDGNASSKKSWRSDYGIKNRQESNLKRLDAETDSPKKQGSLENLENGLRRSSLQESKQHRPLKDLFEMEPTNSLEEVHEVKHQYKVYSNSPQETKQENPVKSVRFAKLKNKQHLGNSPKKRYPVEGWDRTLNFKTHQEATKQSPHKSPLESNSLPQHHGDSPKNIYMIEPAQSFSGGQNHDQKSTFSPVKSRRPTFSSDTVSADDTLRIVPSRADGVCEDSSSNKDGRTLKSCLKNKSSRSRGLRVKFALPGEVEEKLRAQVFRFEPADFP